MKDEIKEILDGFKEILDNPTTSDECYDGRTIVIDRSYDLDLDEIKLLLDCITNLQEKLKETADLCSKHFVKIQTLKEELKSANESITWWQNRFNAIQEENERLNNIINKLEEYLNKVIETSTEMESITCSFVLKYLQELKGADKE